MNLDLQTRQRLRTACQIPERPLSMFRGHIPTAGHYQNQECFTKLREMLTILEIMLAIRKHTWTEEISESVRKFIRYVIVIWCLLKRILKLRQGENLLLHFAVFIKLRII